MRQWVDRSKTTIDSGTCMVQEMSYKGEWRRQGTDEFYAGTLTFDPVNGAQLEIVGRFSSGLIPTAIELIIGKTASGWITLLDTMHSNGQASHETGASVTIYRPVFILDGYAFESIEAILFRSVQFSLFNLLEWFDRKAITENMKKDNYSLEYKSPDAIPFTCYAGCSGKIEFALEGKYLHDWYDIQLTQGCKISLQYENSRTFKDILHDIFVFVRFLTLCTYEQSYPLKIELNDEDLLDEFCLDRLKKGVPKTITCYYRNTFYRSDYQKRKWIHHLVRYGSIESLFPSIIQEWFGRSDQLEQPIELLVRSFINKYDFSVEKFMDMAKALELFHRLNFTNEILSNEVFEARKLKFCSMDLSREERIWIHQKLEHANEPNLKKRLAVLVEKYAFPYLDGREPNRKKFCRKAADCRNYYTHFDPRLKDRSLKGKELFALSENLKLLLIAAVLGSIGIPTEAIEETVQILIY